MEFFEKITDITEDVLAGSRLVIFDLDNTLVVPETIETRQEIVTWLSGVKKNRECLIVSNSRSAMQRKERVEQIFGCPLFYNQTRKPSRRLFQEISGRYEIPTADIVVIGDRLLTDGFFAKINGARAVLVAPLALEPRFFLKIVVSFEKLLLYLLKFTSR